MTVLEEGHFPNCRKVETVTNIQIGIAVVHAWIEGVQIAQVELIRGATERIAQFIECTSESVIGIQRQSGLSEISHLSSGDHRIVSGDSVRTTEIDIGILCRTQPSHSNDGGIFAQINGGRSRAIDVRDVVEVLAMRTGIVYSHQEVVSDLMLECQTEEFRIGLLDIGINRTQADLGN